jgi:hypothetical protein
MDDVVLPDWVNFLRQQNVSTVYIAGVTTDYCVKFTALDAKALGFSTVLVEDGCRGVDLQPGDVQEAINQMTVAGVTVVRGFQFLKIAKGNAYVRNQNVSSLRKPISRAFDTFPIPGSKFGRARATFLQARASRMGQTALPVLSKRWA